MKIKKNILILFFMFVYLSGCNKKYKYLQDINMIDNINIVWIEEDIGDLTTSSLIEDIQLFIEEFNQIVPKQNITGNPQKISFEYVISINYVNGDYEIISHHEQIKLINGIEKFSRLSWNKEEFNNFIEKFWKE